MMPDAMHRAHATRISVAHVPDAMHVRTNELTHADAYKTESRSHLSNAHERNPLHRWIETDTGLAKCPTCYPKARTA